MNKKLNWVDNDLSPGDYVASADADNSRVYKVVEQAEHDRWMATLSPSQATGAMARGWTHTREEAFKLAQDWEDLLTKWDGPDQAR